MCKSFNPKVNIKNIIPPKASPTPTNLFFCNVKFMIRAVPKIELWERTTTKKGKLSQIENPILTSQTTKQRFKHQKNVTKKNDDIGFVLLAWEIIIYQKYEYSYRILNMSFKFV